MLFRKILFADSAMVVGMAQLSGKSINFILGSYPEGQVYKNKSLMVQVLSRP